MRIFFDKIDSRELIEIMFDQPYCRVGTGKIYLNKKLLEILAD